MKKLLAALACACALACKVPVQPPHPPPLPPPQPSGLVAFDTVVCAQPAHGDHCDAPISGATVTVDDAPPRIQTSNADGYNLWTVPCSLVDTFISADAPGYLHFQSATVNPSTPDCQPGPFTKQHNIVTLTPSWPQPVARAPLTLEGNDGTLICHHDLPSGLQIPVGPDKRFWRGDAWGVTVPGLPFVSQGSSKHPERALTWFFDRWSADWQQRILNAYRQRGYTHFALSWPDSRDGNGQNVAQFVATALRVKQAIPYVAVFLTSKDYDARDATPDARMASVAPVVDALVAANAVDLIVAGWELDTFNRGDYLEGFLRALAQRYPGVDIGAHFTTYKTSWQADGQPRAAFWTSLASALQGGARPWLLYQGNQNDSCGAMQAHFNDAMVPASGLQAVNAVLVPWELVAMNEFDGDHPNEDDANARGWELLATPGPLLASGFGNGARYPSGAPTLAAYPR